TLAPVLRQPARRGKRHGLYADATEGSFQTSYRECHLGPEVWKDPSVASAYRPCRFPRRAGCRRTGARVRRDPCTRLGTRVIRKPRCTWVRSSYSSGGLTRALG